MFTANGKIAWTHPMGSPVTGAVAVDDKGFIYAAADSGKIVVCVSLSLLALAAAAVAAAAVQTARSMRLILSRSCCAAERR